MSRHNALSQASPKPKLVKDNFDQSYLSSARNTLTDSNTKKFRDTNSPFELTKKGDTEDKFKRANFDEVREYSRKMEMKEFTVEDIFKLIGELKSSVKRVNDKVDRIQESVGLRLANVQAEIVLFNGKLNFIENNMKSLIK